VKKLKWRTRLSQNYGKQLVVVWAKIDGSCTKYETGKLDFICTSSLRLFKAMATSSSVADMYAFAFHTTTLKRQVTDEKEASKARSLTKCGAIAFTSLLPPTFSLFTNGGGSVPQLSIYFPIRLFLCCY
jgi:hypothetical protein